MKTFKNTTKKILFFEIKGVSHAIKPGQLAELDPENDYVKTMVAKEMLATTNKDGKTSNELVEDKKKADELEAKKKAQDEGNSGGAKKTTTPKK